MRGQLCLGKPGYSEDRHSGPPKRSVARLGEPLSLGGGRLCLGVLAMVRGLCLWPVLGRSRGLVHHYCGLLQGP